MNIKNQKHFFRSFALGKYKEFLEFWGVFQASLFP